MMQLPHEMRDTLVEQLDEYFDAQSGAPDGETVAAYVIELIGTVAEEMKLDDGVEIILKLESSGEMEASLLELLEEEFESNDEFEYTGEEIVSLVEKVCEIEWTTKDEDDADEDDDKDDDGDDPDGFFDAVAGDDDDD
ncbi:MAG: hypothetical protein Q8P18_04180 [Pseudomonadota bacterium]|nr:hypothetical protein [Pseudomonadota bacterium]